MSREYRFLLRDPLGGAPYETLLLCLDDEGAMLLADRLSVQRSVEVWDEDRFVGKADAVGRPAPPPAPEPKTRVRHFWTGAWRRGLEDPPGG
jgi:hypothetical protein